MAPENGQDVLSKTHRLLLGILVLMLVDVIWVSSSEATKYLYRNDSYQKPFFTTYVKTSMFTIYLLGLCFWPPWREQCSRNQSFIHLENAEDEPDLSTSLSDPQFVPVKRADRSSGTESDDSSVHSVRFNKVAEVRHMSTVDASDALLARLSYNASVRAGENLWRTENKLPIQVVARVALLFCYLVSDDPLTSETWFVIYFSGLLQTTHSNYPWERLKLELWRCYLQLQEYLLCYWLLCFHLVLATASRFQNCFPFSWASLVWWVIVDSLSLQKTNRFRRFSSVILISK